MMLAFGRSIMGFVSAALAAMVVFGASCYLAVAGKQPTEAQIIEALTAKKRAANGACRRRPGRRAGADHRKCGKKKPGAALVAGSETN